MNLAERRVVRDFQTNQAPGYLERIHEALGFEAPVEIDWETLAQPGESRLYAESWPDVYFEPLIGGLKTVGRDQLGKDALKDGLKKIVIQNTIGCYNPDRWAAFEDGVLTLDHEPLTNVGDKNEREDALVKLLESKL